MTERTVVVFKPDSVERGLVGEILARFERAGIRIVGSKTVKASKPFIGLHYPDKEEFLRRVGEKTIQEYGDAGLDPKQELGTLNPLELGKQIREWSVEYLAEGPVIAFVLEGPQAVKIIRKMVGALSPSTSAPGTIRGDYSVDSSFVANRERRSIRNLIHASGNPEEAQEEIKLWFKEDELV